MQDDGSEGPSVGWTIARLRYFRDLDDELQRRPRRIAWILGVAAIPVSWSLVVRPTAGGYGSDQDSAGAFLLGAGGLIALVALWRAMAYLSVRRANPEAGIVALWSAEAGPQVVTMVMDGGPKLDVDGPIRDYGVGPAWEVANLGGGHPLLAAGVLAVSAAVNGVSLVLKRTEKQAAQAALTAQYRAVSRQRLTAMRRRQTMRLDRHDAARMGRLQPRARFRLATSLSITEFALEQVGPELGAARPVVPATASPRTAG